MGTNYFLFTRSKRLAHTHFASENDWGVTDEEYEITEEPYLGYEVHLNKCSAGWRPLFQCHSAFDSFLKAMTFCRIFIPSSGMLPGLDCIRLSGRISLVLSGKARKEFMPMWVLPIIKGVYIIMTRITRSGVNRWIDTKNVVDISYSYIVEA